MSICVEELQRCQQLSPRPNFIVLLAERYGWRPLPPRIDAAELEMLLSQLDSAAQAALGAWYQRDDNATPPVYWLRPRGPAYADPQCWAEEEVRLLNLLLAAAMRAFPVDDRRRQRYERSATHQEIELGALSVDDADQHVYCYFRATRGLPEGAEAARHKDVRHGEPDPDASARQALLQADLKRRLPPDHIYEWQAEWRDGELTSDLAELCRRVEDDLKATIDLELSAFEQVPPLERERDAHRAFASERAAHFVGRQDLLQQIESYLGSDDRRPLVVYGLPGSGKSALLAESSRRLVERDAAAYVLTRFIGATPDSSDLRYLLTGVAQELGQVYGIDAELPDDPRALADELKPRLAASTAERPLVVYVDALDQLSDAEVTRALTWLPRELGPDTKLVVSILEDDGPAGACLRHARGLLPAERFLKVGPLPSKDGALLLESWLAEAGRTLRPEQRRHVLDRFAGCPYPLYLKLAFEEARRWRSDDGSPPLGQDVAAILGDLFTRLERSKDHGPVLPARGLAYLAASRRGLSEDELLDVLSADEQVMDELRRRSPDSPRADRLPVVLWSRLLADLEPYLTRHERHGAQLLAFYHRQVEAAVRARYLVDEGAVSAHRRPSRPGRRPSRWSSRPTVSFWRPGSGPPIRPRSRRAPSSGGVTVVSTVTTSWRTGSTTYAGVATATSCSRLACPRGPTRPARSGTPACTPRAAKRSPATLPITPWC